jgi:transcription antitermination protein NusB
MKKKDQRHRGREAALQILYQSDIGRTTPQQATETFFSAQWPDEEPASAELERFAWQLVSETVEHRDRIEALIAETALRWRPERMPIVDRLILQLAICELLFRPDTPPAVVINEALELARTFSTEDAVKFINGMLDAIRRRIDAGAPGGKDAKDTTE